MSIRTANTLVVCLGNELVADDAVGYEVYRRLDAIDARVEYLPVGGTDILPLLKGVAYLLVVDAVQFGYPPGTLHCIDWDDLPAPCPAISAHGVGLREAIEVGKILCPERIPPQITLLGIEGKCFDRPREFMTPQVSDAIEPAVCIVKGIVGGNR